MASIAKVVVEISLDREFDYRIPAHLKDSIKVGSQVNVPFKSRELRGFVVGLSNYSAFGDKLKEIAGVVGDKPLIPESVVALATWIADYYCAPIENAVRTVLPSAVRRRGAKHKKQLFVSLVDAPNVDGASCSVQDDRRSNSIHCKADPCAQAQRNGAGSSIYEEERINYFDVHEPVGNEQGNLPHWRQQGATYFVTFRLGDSLPQEKLNQWRAELAIWLRAHPEPHDEATKREYYELFPQRFQNWLDQGMGSCILAKPEMKEIVEDALLHFDGDRYKLREYAVMPNHVHMLISPLGEHLLSEILHSLKSFTANEINKRIKNELKPVWQHESFDHIVRSPEQVERIRKYIHDNPSQIVDGASSSVSDDRQPLADPLLPPVDPALPAQPSGAGSSVYDKLPPKQKFVVETLQEHGAMTLSELKERSGCSDSPIRTLEKNGLVKIEEETILRDPHMGLELLRTQPFNLMAEQQTALDIINASMDKEKPGTVLLHGVTGSGKTEVYLQAIQHALDKGQGAIVLVPEIALTPQTVDRFRSRFGDCVAVLHSSLSDGERHDEWHRIRNGEAQIAIGARSALFSPIENPGLIVVDEEHEATYKQDESPRYNARDVAVMRGHLENCCVVLGSATPAMESFKNVRDGRYELAEMLLRVDDRSMPLMRIVDMCIESEKDGRPQIFSTELVEGIYDRLNLREQVILFLNRRGFSSSLQCEKCGYVAECSECSVSMTYHKRAHKLLCHICGAEEKVPNRCPDCGDPDFKYAGMGTERIEEVLGKLCPNAKVARMDSDTMRKKDSYRKVLDQFRTGKIDILLGTQMIAKGLDFPNVTLVGVLNADMSLHVPDFRAGERTFQLLTQVAGRAGRGEKAGEVIVQAYTPHHPAIQAARSLDYDGFCSQDLEFRKELCYPPYSHLVLLTFKGECEGEVMSVADGFSARLEKILPESVTHSPPVPAPLARAKGLWRYQIMLRCEHTVKMTRPIRHVRSVYKIPKTVTCTVDVDALSLL
ncbi:replication restart helicase PriA [Pontiella sulfatireligans]|uniref:Replication restart protein PriA n=1 Tax=Pontiella sulfatireligans TaxID=2750658 RepID=A0A6C2UNP5_9BACT|nr:primosomal protein N' [Pontiella sulfatireligans]VGO21808.1 Primosomal protein N' [Pontiella sulfatireligans]